MEYKEKKKFLEMLFNLSKKNSKESKFIDEETNFNYSFLAEIESDVWNIIAELCEMPEEQLGKWVSDFWLELLWSYENDEVAFEDIADKFINWEKYSKERFG